MVVMAISLRREADRWLAPAERADTTAMGLGAQAPIRSRSLGWRCRGASKQGADRSFNGHEAGGNQGQARLGSAVSIIAVGTWRPGGAGRVLDRPAEGSTQAAETARGRVLVGGTGTDRLVVAVRPGNAGGARGPGCPGSLGGQPVWPGGAG
jgi:hypothetical protein